MKAITPRSLIINLIQTLAIILFISLSTHFFGQQEALTSVATITALLMFLYIPLPTHPLQGALATSSAYMLGGSIASLNLLIHPLIALPLNILTITALMILFGQQFQYKFFMPYTLIYIFASTTEVPDFSISQRLSYLALSSILIGLLYYSRYRTKSDERPFFKLSVLTPKLFQTALMMSLGISAALLLTHSLHLSKGMWIAMTVMSLTQLHPEETKQRFRFRLLGTVSGTILYVLLFTVLVPEHYHIWLVMIAAYIYAFVDNYFIQLIFITMNVLYASKELFTFNDAFMQRLGFILLGSLIVFSLLTLTKLINNHSPFKKIVS